MLTQEQNDALTRTDPGTLGGKLLRSYWQPIALSSECSPHQPVEIVRHLRIERLRSRQRVRPLHLREHVQRAPERRRARAQLERDDAERVHVHRRRHREVRDVFRRQNRYYSALAAGAGPSKSQPEAPGAKAAGPEAKDEK